MNEVNDVPTNCIEVTISANYCRSLEKVKLSLIKSDLLWDQSVGWSIGCDYAQNCPISDYFNMTPKYFLPLLPYLYWPSTTKYWTIPPHSDPVPPSTNYYSPILTHYHQVPQTSAQFTPPGLVYTFLQLRLCPNYVHSIDFLTILLLSANSIHPPPQTIYLESLYFAC